MYSPLNYPCENGTVSNDCEPYCLYNIIDDPGERKYLSQTNKQRMIDRYNSHTKEDRDMLDHSRYGLPDFAEACQYMKDHGVYWRPSIG